MSEGTREDRGISSHPFLAQAATPGEMASSLCLQCPTSPTVVPAPTGRPQRWAVVTWPLLLVLQARGGGKPLLLLISAFLTILLAFSDFPSLG